MDEVRKDALRLDFNRKLKLEFHGTKVISDGGLLTYREFDDALGLTSTVDSQLRDIQTGRNTQHYLAALLRHSRYVMFRMAEVVVPQTLFREILGRIRQLRFWQYLRGRDDACNC
ncbi:MAG: transposase [Planctomycetota bacterium]